MLTNPIAVRLTANHEISVGRYHLYTSSLPMCCVCIANVTFHNALKKQNSQQYSMIQRWYLHKFDNIIVVNLLLSLFVTVAAIVAVVFTGLAICLIIICCGLVCLRRWLILLKSGQTIHVWIITSRNMNFLSVTGNIKRYLCNKWEMKMMVCYAIYYLSSTQNTTR